MHNVMSTENPDMQFVKMELQARNQNLGLVLILAVRISILLRNWIDFLSH